MGNGRGHDDDGGGGAVGMVRRVRGVSTWSAVVPVCPLSRGGVKIIMIEK